MKLLIEEIEPDQVEHLTEEVNGKTRHYIHGVFMQSAIPNGNNRIYPEEIMDNAAKSYNQVYVNQSRAYGELGHPDTPKINLERVSHRIVELKKDGKNYIGKAMLMDTPYGTIAKQIMESGGRLGVSTRGVGTTKKDHTGKMIVQDNFRLATAADIVVDPSAPDAFVQSMMEDKDWIWENGVWREEDLMEAKNNIKAAAKAELEITALEEFTKLISKL